MILNRLYFKSYFLNESGSVCKVFLKGRKEGREDGNEEENILVILSDHFIKYNLI